MKNIFFIPILVLMVSPLVNATEINASLVKNERQVTPIFQYQKCTDEQLSQVSKFQETKFKKTKYEATNAQMNSQCGNGCVALLYYPPENFQSIEYYEQKSNGTCVLNSIQDKPYFEASTFSSKIEISKVDLEKMNISADLLKNIKIRKSQFGRVRSSSSNDEVMRLNFNYSQKPIFDKIKIGDSVITVNFN